MEKRMRSPNYPAISLPDAIEKVKTLYADIHKHPAPREVVAKGMGYNSLNGASATAISALHKYGLLEKAGGSEVKVSDRALRILHPHSPEERSDAIREAAFEPPLFAEIAERFPGRAPNDELLRNYLVRKAFAPSAVSSVILAYRETSKFADEAVGDYDSGMESTSEASPMQAQTHDVVHRSPPPQAAKPAENSREIGKYNFEEGGFVQILAGGTVDIEEVLDMVETLVHLKRKELKRRKASESQVPAKAADGGEEEGALDEALQ